MNAHRAFSFVLVLASLAGAAARSALAADEASYYKACYLQSDERDFAAAATLFEQAAGDDQLPADIRAAATRRLAECREELAAADLAGLMPAESIAYVQLANIGSQAKTVLESLGLAGETADGVSGPSSWCYRDLKHVQAGRLLSLIDTQGGGNRCRPAHNVVDVSGSGRRISSAGRARIVAPKRLPPWRWRRGRGTPPAGRPSSSRGVSAGHGWGHDAGPCSGPLDSWPLGHRCLP